MWDSQVGSLPPKPLTNTRLNHVTSATPAKRITFYKSGDNQFGGIKMAIHNRSFKCFDALLDDLSQKVPLPFGVRTVTTPRGTHSIKHLEQLQDGACYLCSDRRQAKSVNAEVTTKPVNPWHHHNRKPQKPEEAPPGHRQRRILLVKNSEPGLRRSMVLSKRLTRSLRTFLEDVSEVMQFHVRKLYTPEGRKIDSMQSLMTCQGVLVCVGREAFSPLLINLARKSPEDKLPGLGTRSPGLGPRTPGNGARSPTNQRSPPHGTQSKDFEINDGNDSKRNVYFGLETKKSIIHPRPDSSNRCARFSLSSDKSCNHGLCTLSHCRPSVNDDIEKRVLVNKDGSLSLEMRVRFRLHKEETLQWCTQIKKTPSLTDNSCSLPQDQSQYLRHGPSESCSDPDSTTFESEFVNHALQNILGSNCCQCGSHKEQRQYDLWENPAHKHKHIPAPPRNKSRHTHTVLRHSHSSSSSSSCHSRRAVRCHARLSDFGAASGSEQNQLVKDEVCVTKEVQRRVEIDQCGDTRMEVSMIRRCCSRGEVTTIDNDPRPNTGKLVDNETMMKVEEAGEEERPLSVISNSSHVLQALKEDQDDEEGDPPISASPSTSNVVPSPNSQTSLKSGNTSGRSRVTSSCNGGVVTPHSNKSTRIKTANSEGEEALNDNAEIKSVLSECSKVSEQSSQSGVFSPCPCCGGCKSTTGVDSRASRVPFANIGDEVDNTTDGVNDESVLSKRSSKSDLTNHRGSAEIANAVKDRQFSATSRNSNGLAKDADGRAPSTSSVRSHVSSRSQQSGRNGMPGLVSERKVEGSPCAMSSRSSPSAMCNGVTTNGDIDEDDADTRSVSVVSAKSNKSKTTDASVKSDKSSCQLGIFSSAMLDSGADVIDFNERACSGLTIKSDERSISPKCNISDAAPIEQHQPQHEKLAEENDCPLPAKSSQLANGIDKMDLNEVGERPVSAVSSKISLLESNKSCICTDDSERAEEEETAIKMSAASVKSDTSANSKRHSAVGSCSAKVNEKVEETGNEKVGEEMPMQSESTKSVKSEHETRPPRADFINGYATEAGDTNIRENSDKANGISNCDIVTASPANEKGNTEVGRTTSAMSGNDKERRGQLSSTRSGKSGSSVKSTVSRDSKGPSVSPAHSTISNKSKCKCHYGTDSSQHKAQDDDIENLKKEVKECDQVLNTKGDKEPSKCASSILSSSPSSMSEGETSANVGLIGNQEQEAADLEVDKVQNLPNPHARSEADTKTENLSLPKDTVQLETTGSSQGSAPVDIPTIRTPGSEDVFEDVKGDTQDRAPTALSTEGSSVKSSNSHKSSCSCKNRATSTKGVTVCHEFIPDSKATSSPPPEKIVNKSPRSISPKPRHSTTSTTELLKETLDSLSVSASSTQSCSKTKVSQPLIGDDNKNSNLLRVTRGCKGKSSAGSDSSSTKSAKISKSQMDKTSVTSSKTCPLHERNHNTQPPPAADPLIAVCASSPNIHQSKASVTSSKTNSKKKARDVNVRTNSEEKLQVTPACLPSISPNEVVNNWLLSIPPNNCLLTPGDEQSQGEELVQETQNNRETVEREAEFLGDARETKVKKQTEEKKQGVCDGAVSAADVPSHQAAELLPRSCQSSAAVMKVLLSAPRGRCHSLPEVSPVYGRRLSTSAKVLLDCLAQLQLIQPAVDPSNEQNDTKQCSEEIKSILQSLWLNQQRDLEGTNIKGKQITPPRSSSGVDMNSYSGEMTKDKVKQVDTETASTQPCNGGKDIEVEGITGEKENNVAGENSAFTRGEELIVKTELTFDKTKAPLQSEDHCGAIATTLDSPKASEPASSDKISTNNSSKAPTDNSTLEDCNNPVTDIPVSRQRSHDPNPAWVLNLLKKVEKQFMSHYISAMADFKVRWDLDDSLILNTMITELKDEVGRRIQSSIQCEVKKIQSRAGKGGWRPRPPEKNNLSRESTATERRRRLLKVMKNQSVKTGDSLSDGDMTAEFSDPRSEDEYCPCDACIRKKTAARPLKTKAVEAPVMMEFDLRKILNLKKTPVPPPAALSETVKEKNNIILVDEGERNLEVVQEEEENLENKEDIELSVSQENTSEKDDRRHGVTGEYREERKTLETLEMKVREKPECTCRVDRLEESTKGKSKEKGDKQADSVSVQK